MLDERFHRTGFWNLVNSYNVTWINAVPAIISRLCDLPSGEAPSRRIRFVRSASAPLAPALFERFEAEVGVPDHSVLRHDRSGQSDLRDAH